MMNQNALKNMIVKKLLQAEKWAPRLTSRVWGLWQNPLSKVFGWDITQLTETQVELHFRAPSLSSASLIAAGEFAIATLWKRHLPENGEKLILKDCQCEIMGDKHFVARTELLETDREHALRQSEIEHTVLIFDQKDIMTARVRYAYIFKKRNVNLLSKGVF